MAAYLTGLRCGDWWRLLHEHAPAVDHGYRLRAGWVSVGTVVTSLVARCEPEVRWSDEQERLWREPLIILGLPRSGTTWLHQSLALNPFFAYPTRLDCFNPWICLTLHRWGAAGLLGKIPWRPRGMDQVQVGWSSPEEDEFALAALTASGPWIARTFRRSCAERGRSLMVDYAEGEAPLWQNALRLFTRKLISLTRRRLVLKSPLHTGRIRALLELFPAARFVTIFRDPREQLRSAIDVPEDALNWGTVQVSPSVEVVGERWSRIADSQHALLTRYFDQRGLIPPGRLWELTFEQLAADPLGTLERLHERLGLQGWNETRARLAASRCVPYEGNRSRPLTRCERELALTAYNPLFTAGYYPEVRQALRSETASSSA